MHLIYSDESGTAKNQPVTIVSAVVMDPDRHVRQAERLMAKMIADLVPTELQTGFIFHAADIWNKYQDHPGWTRDQRLVLIGAVASIPRLLGGAVAVGRVRRDAPRVAGGAAISEVDMQHAIAFWNCMSRIDGAIQGRSAPDVVAILVAEDIPSKRKMLRKMLRFKVPAVLPAHVLLTKEELETGVVTQARAPRAIERIIDTVHFVEKTEGPMLQIADACAYCFRRFASGENMGGRLTQMMLGKQLVYEDWLGPSSSWIWWYGAPPEQPSA